MTTMMTGRVVRGLGIAMLAGAFTAGPAFMPEAQARDEDEETTCVPDPGNLSAIICSIGSSGGPSTFLGSFASDNSGAGGWTEYYADDDGEWWVEHHANGDTEVGWDLDGMPGGNANYITGPKFGSNQEGSYDDKPRPELSGAVTTGPSLSYAAAKAAASNQTGVISGITAPASVVVAPSGGSASITVNGSGKCMAAIVLKKSGSFVSSTGIVPITMGVSRKIALPGSVGTYTLEVQGKDGCLGQVRSATITVKRPVFNFSLR